MKIKLATIIVISLLSLFACDKQKVHNKETEKIMDYKFYLEAKNHQELKHDFWELSLKGKSINIREGQIDSKGELTKKDFLSEPIARYETYKKILAKRNEGYHSPSLVTMKTFLSYEPISIDRIDKQLYGEIQYDNYSGVLMVDGDLHLDYLDLDAFPSLSKGIIIIVITGNLVVDGGIYNIEGDYGPALIVKGNVQADYLIGGGSEISLEGNSFIHSFVLGHYNHGSLSIANLTTLIEISDDHHSEINGDVFYGSYHLNPNGGNSQREKLGSILGSTILSYFDNDFFDSKMFITLLRNKNQSLELLKHVLDANHAHASPELMQVRKDGLAIKEIKNPDEELQLAAVSENGIALQYIKKPSETIQIEAIKQDYNALEFISNQSEEVQLAAVDENGSLAFPYLNKPSKKVIELALKNDGLSIEYIKEPSEAYQMLAVSNNGEAIKYINNPSEEIKLVSVQNYGKAIQHIKKPSEILMLAAVQENGESIEYINQPSDAVMLAAVTKNAHAIRYIKNPSDATKLVAVQNEGWLIEYIKNPSEALMIAAISEDAAAMEGISNPSEALQLMAIKEDAYNISYIKNPTKKVQIAAVNDVTGVIRYLSNPCEEVQLIAIKEDPSYIYESIKNPTEKVKLLAKAALEAQKKGQNKK